jgi:TetR/AcrR family transcriptional repressor of nem operon
MADLASAVGLLKGSFYHYFLSKEELMKEVLESIESNLRHQVYPIAYRHHLPAQRRMELFLKQFSKVVFSKDGGCIVGNTILETANHYPPFQKILQSLINEITSSLAHLYQENHSPEIALKLAQQTIMEFEGAVMMAKLYRDGTYYKDCYLRAIKRIDA